MLLHFRGIQVCKLFYCLLFQESECYPYRRTAPSPAAPETSAQWDGVEMARSRPSPEGPASIGEFSDKGPVPPIGDKSKL